MPIAYSVSWTDRLDLTNSVSFVLVVTRLATGAISKYNVTFNQPPAQVDQAFLDNKSTTVVIPRQTALDMHADNMATFISTNADLSLIIGNATDAQTLITRNALTFTVAQIKARFQTRLDALNIAVMREIADQVSA